MVRGRRVWVDLMDEHENIIHVEDYIVLKVRKLLPAGPVAIGEPSAYDGIRSRDLVQLYTDPGGFRTLNAAHIHMKDPRKRKIAA